MLPLSFVFLFLKEFMAKMQNPSAEPHNFWVYIAIAVVIYFVMYFIYALSYDSTYESVYSECKKRRITLAEKLRKLPLAFFGKKDLSDLTSRTPFLKFLQSPRCSLSAQSHSSFTTR